MERLLLFALLLGGLTSAAYPADDRGVTKHSFTAVRLGGPVSIQVYADDAAVAKKAAHAAFDEARLLDAIFSDYDPGSEASRIAQTLQGGVARPAHVLRPEDASLETLPFGPSGIAVPVTAPMADLLQRSRTISQATGGAFDITIGPLTKLWRIAKRRRRIPRDNEVSAAMAAVGHEKLSFVLASRSDVKRPTYAGEAATLIETRTGLRVDAASRLRPLAEQPKPLRLRVLACPARVAFDFGGCAKGYVLERMAARLRDRDLYHFLIDAGGDIVLSGRVPAIEKISARPWTVAIAPTRFVRDLPTEVLSLPVPQTRETNAPVDRPRDLLCVATSGDAAKGYDYRGDRYSHLIDPRTGQAVRRRSSVTVISDDAVLADALASAFSVEDPAGHAAMLARVRDRFDATRTIAVRVAWIERDGVEQVRTLGDWDAVTSRDQ